MDAPGHLRLVARVSILIMLDSALEVVEAAHLIVGIDVSILIMLDSALEGFLLDYARRVCGGFNPNYAG